MRKKTSPIWQVSKAKLITYVNASKTFTEVLEKFGLQLKGNNNQTLKQRLHKDNIDYGHITPTHKYEGVPIAAKPLENILVENSQYNRCHLKNRLIKEGILQYHCASCGCDTWLDKPLMLQLDHINGISNDNRIENLRLLCPNCHSQTNTFGGKNKKTSVGSGRGRYFTNSCKDCGTPILNNSTRCKKCAANNRTDNRKVLNRPSLQQLLLDVKQLGYVGAGKKYGVSDNSIRKWIKKYQTLP